jgi:endonuclease/exonuclease/phosphatase family metal-dependent hydrolase
MFIFSFLIGYSDWERLYKLPNNAIPVAKGLKLMSFNVRLFNSYNWIDEKNIPQSVLSFVNLESPDILCLQEFSKEFSPPFKNYPYNYIRSSTKHGQNGLSIMSKYPLFNKGFIPFENSNNSAVYAEIYYKSDTLRIYNLHLESLRINLKDTLFTKKNSQKFINRLTDVIKKQEVQMDEFQKIDQNNLHPSIICTDLNNNAFSKIYKGIKNNRIDAFSHAGDGLGGTYNFAYFPFRIDFIFVDPKMEIIDFNTHSVNLSDHKPVSAVLRWR